MVRKKSSVLVEPNILLILSTSFSYNPLQMNSSDPFRRLVHLAVLSSEDENMESSVDVEIDHCPVINCFLLIGHFETKAAEQHGREDLHLPVRKLLP